MLAIEPFHGRDRYATGKNGRAASACVLEWSGSGAVGHLTRAEGPDPGERESPQQPFVVLARPEGAGRALATYRMPIEGHDEWIAAARRLA
jgi:hypothetical protein